ncbi:MAG: DHA1 family bicyclomycin/chloramphenicol resistance-like MFS transporter [Rickettsiales bacterium]|jgi:DHA1 family bicyclomycin/chloramphenicol resistance-like MFS transporter
MPKKSFIFFIIILGSIVAIGPLAIDMYLPAFSEMASFFAVSNDKIQLTLSSYFIGIAVGQIFYGPVIDRFGKKPPLIFGLLLFVVTSFLCALTEEIDQMIWLRFFQAAGACSCFVVMRAIVRDLFSPQESARVFSYLLLVMGIAPIVAPLLGGYVLINFGWQAIFWFLGSFALLLILVSILYLPESQAGDKSQKISGAFRKYYGIVKDKNFLFYSLSGGFSACGMFIYIVGSPFVIIEIFGISPENYGWVFGINAVGYVFAAQVNGYLLKSFELKRLLNVAFKISLFAAILLMICGVYFPNIWAVSAAFFLYVSLIGVITPNSSALSLANQRTHSGSASALFGTIQFTICAVAAFLISHFHNGTIMPMIIAISSCGIIAFFINYYWQKKSISAK